jgi:hypothetical protein
LIVVSFSGRVWYGVTLAPSISCGSPVPVRLADEGVMAVAADAEGERQRRDERESGLAPQHARGVADVLEQRAHGVTPSLIELLLTTACGGVNARGAGNRAGAGLHLVRDHAGRLVAATPLRRACRTSVSRRSVSARSTARDRRQPVVATPFVVFSRGRAAIGLFHEFERFEPGQRGMECAGAEAERAASAIRDVADDRVAVQVPVGERQQDVELLRRERALQSLHERGRSGGQQIGLVAQLAAQLSVAPTPGLEAPRDRVEQPSFVWGAFVKGRPAEKTRAQRGIPADVVPSTQLVLEESRQQQALRACRFHHQAVMQEGRIRYKMVEDIIESRWSRQVDVGLRGDLGVVRQQAGVVKQFLLIDGGLGYVLQALNEKLQRLPVVDRD